MERLALAGEIDAVNAGRVLGGFLAEINRLPVWSREALEYIEIDCSGIEFIDSSGLGMLLALYKRADKPLVLLDVPEQCRKVFELTGFDQLFELRAS